MLHQSAQEIEIISENTELRDVNLYDSCGKLVASRHGNATNKVVFQVGLFRKGIYIVQVNEQRMKFVK